MRSTAAFSLLAACLSASAWSQEIAKPSGRNYAFRTSAGFYLTAENGGGTTVNTDRKELGPWESFTLVNVSPGVFAFRSETGHYLGEITNERRIRQGRGGLAASKKDMDSSTHFRILIVNPDGPVVALMTAAGKYVTAENNGGMKARSARAMATDRTEIGEWEQFTLVDVEKEKAQPRQ